MANIPEGFELVDDIPEGFELVDSGFTGASVIEPALAIASAIPASIAAGVTGLVAGGVGGTDAAETVRGEVQETFSYEPRTKAGKEGLKTTGEIVDFLGQAFVNIPASGLVGLADLITSGFDFEEAAKGVKSTQEQGIIKEIGGRTFEATGSPAAATLAELIPEAAATALGLRTAKTASKAASSIAPDLTEGVATGAKALQEVAASSKDALKGIKTPKQKEIALRLKSGDIDADNAMFELSKDGIENPNDFQRMLGLDLPTIKKNMPSVRVKKQGFEDAFIGDVRGLANENDLLALNKMTSIAEKGSKSNVFKTSNRPSYVVGDILLNKVNKIKAINKKAGVEINNAAKKLKGKVLSASDIGDNFNNVLSGLKVKIEGDKLNFEDSIVSGAGRRKAIADIYGRMKRNKNPDALDLHELKQYIDETVSYGKDVRGLGGKAERALKDLRFSIKTKLEESFPEYAKANKNYSETIEALDEIQRLAGKNTDLTSDSAGGQLASLARRITSEAQSKSQVIEAVKKLDAILGKNAKQADSRLIGNTPDIKTENLALLMDYAQQLDRITGSSAATSFTGASEIAIKAAKGPREFIIEKATEAAKGISGVTPENAYKAMNEFVNSELKNKAQK